jgi:GST-like protein
MGLAYNVYPINIGKDEQFAPDFLKISPSNKIPVVVDMESGISVFESGAILIYLGEKSRQFYRKDLAKRMKVNETLMWQMGGFGPSLAAPMLSFSQSRQSALCRTDVRQGSATTLRRARHSLGKSGFRDGDYSIAAIAIFPWAARHQW